MGRFMNGQEPNEELTSFFAAPAADTTAMGA